MTVAKGNRDGSITAPLLYRAASGSPWQRVERIEVAITPAMLDGFVLDAAPTALPVGTLASWAEQRPGSFTRIVDPPPVTPTATPPTMPPTSTPSGAPSPYKVFVPVVED